MAITSSTTVNVFCDVGLSVAAKVITGAGNLKVSRGMATYYRAVLNPVAGNI